MAKSLQHLFERPRPCSYLPGASARLEYRVLLDVRLEELDALLERGWRRFGPAYFRPQCPACSECVPLRLPVAAFTPSGSQLRAERRMRRFRWEVGPPRVDSARLALYAAWHQGREAQRGWEGSALTAESYAEQFAFPHPAAQELAVYDGERLVALGLCDVTHRAVSAVYFFYSPEVARLSPGVANVMACVRLAQARGVPHVYLGYRVLGCPSLRYKASYRPHELLDGWPAFDAVPRWRPG